MASIVLIGIKSIVFEIFSFDLEVYMPACRVYIV